MRGVESAPSFSAGRAEEPKQFGTIPLSTEQFKPLVKPPTSTAVRTERTLGIIRAGETTYIGDIQVSVERLKSPPKPASDTVARSEGAHAFIAYKLGIGVRKATIQSGHGFLGMVEVDRPDAVVAAAHLGKGDSHDRRVIRWLGADEHASHSTAQGILASDSEGYDAVTTLLEEKCTVNGHQIKEAINQARERKEFVLVVFRTPDGRALKRKTRTVNGEVTVEEIKPSNETTIFDPNLTKKHVELAA